MRRGVVASTTERDPRSVVENCVVGGRAWTVVVLAIVGLCLLCLRFGFICVALRRRRVCSARRALSSRRRRRSQRRHATAIQWPPVRQRRRRRHRRRRRRSDQNERRRRNASSSANGRRQRHDAPPTTVAPPQADANVRRAAPVGLVSDSLAACLSCCAVRSRLVDDRLSRARAEGRRNEQVRQRGCGERDEGAGRKVWRAGARGRDAKKPHNNHTNEQTR